VNFLKLGVAHGREVVHGDVDDVVGVAASVVDEG
jgi:hypothetical protein